MGKVDANKRIKQNTLFQTSFELFHEKGFAKTTISDIVKRAGLAKGTFYLYFKDKYDLRDKLIIHKTSQLFSRAHQALSLTRPPVEGFENQLLFVLDYIIDLLKYDTGLLQFISKNLSWGIFKNVIEKLSEHDDTAEYVTDGKGKPKADSNLRDTEKIPLVQNIDDYFEEEVKKYYSDAWYDDKKNKIGYEINFTQYFYVYEPPRPLEEIEADINKITSEIQELLKE